MKFILNFSSLMLLSIFSLIFAACENDVTSTASETVLKTTDDIVTIGYYADGATELLLSLDEAEQVFQAIMEAEETSGTFVEAYIDDLHEEPESEAYLLFIGDLDDGTSVTYGLTLIKEHGDDLTTFFVGGEAYGPTGWKCENGGCTGRCKINRSWLTVVDCTCMDAGADCKFSRSGGGGSGWGWAVGIAKLIIDIVK